MLAGAAQDVDGALHRREPPPGEVGGARGGPLHGLRPWHVHLLGLSAERPDAPLHVAPVRLGLAQVLLETLLVRRAAGHPDVRLERRLELLLLPVRLVQILDQLDVAGLQLWHR